MLSCKHVIMQTIFLSADRVTLKKIKVTNGVAESEPTVYHYPAGVWVRMESYLGSVKEALNNGIDFKCWQLTHPSEFPCSYGFHQYPFFLIVEQYQKTGETYVGLKRGKVEKTARHGRFFFNKTGVNLDQGEFWTLVRLMPEIKQALNRKQEKKVLLPEIEATNPGAWNSQDRCHMCLVPRGGSPKGLKGKANAVECFLCARYYIPQC